MKTNFIRQIVFAVALAAIASLFNSVQADPVSGFTDDDLVMWQTVSTYDWNNPDYFVTAVNGTLASDSSVGGLSGRDCYVQDLAIPQNNGGNIANPSYNFEIRARSTKSFNENSHLFVGVNKIGEHIFNADNEIDISAYTFSNKQMRLSFGIDATNYDKESDMVYDSANAVSLDRVYLGNGYINNRLREAQPAPGGDGGSGDSTDKPYYAVVGLKGTVYVLPDTNNDDVYRSKITNNNRNRHLVIDEACTMICPEGAKLELESFCLDQNQSELPFALFPICGNIKGNGKVLYHSQREDVIYVLGNNSEFTGKTTIQTDWDTDSARFNHAYVVSGNGTSYTGIKGSEIFIENGNLVLQNNHILNNLGSNPANKAHTRIIGSDAVTTNPFVAGYHYPDAAHHDKTELLILRNDMDTAYYGAIMKGHEQEIAAVDGEGVPILDEQGNQVRYHNYAYINHNYAYTGDTKDFEQLRKEGAATLKLYCAGSDGGIRAESFVISSGRVDFNGYFKGDLTVNAGATFSPDSWNWGNDSAIAVGDNSVTYGDKTYDAVTIDGDIVNNGGKIEFNFSKYETGKNDVISFINNGTFDKDDNGIISLAFMNNDPVAWATEDAEYLMIKGGGFTEGDYSYLLTDRYGNMQTLRQFALTAKSDGNLYLTTVFYVPEPSTWALMVLGAAGLLFWRKKNR